jgi:hypothetical protein
MVKSPFFFTVQVAHQAFHVPRTALAHATVNLKLIFSGLTCAAPRPHTGILSCQFFPYVRRACPTHHLLPHGRLIRIILRVGRVVERAYKANRVC